MQENETPQVSGKDAKQKDSWGHRQWEKIKKLFQQFDKIEWSCIVTVPIISGAEPFINDYLLNETTKQYILSCIDNHFVLIVSSIFMCIFLIISCSNDDYSIIDEDILKAEKDEYLIFGAIGSLGLALLEKNNISFLQNEKNFINVMVVAFYLLLLIAIHYRHLSTEVYRREKATRQNDIIIMSRDRTYTVTSIPPEDEQQ